MSSSKSFDFDRYCMDITRNVEPLGTRGNIAAEYRLMWTRDNIVAKPVVYWGHRKYCSESIGPWKLVKNIAAKVLVCMKSWKYCSIKRWFIKNPENIEAKAMLHWETLKILQINYWFAGNLWQYCSDSLGPVGPKYVYCGKSFGAL